MKEKKYFNKGHVHRDEKKESKKRGVREGDFFCPDCNEYTEYTYEHCCTVCGRRVIWRNYE